MHCFSAKLNTCKQEITQYLKNMYLTDTNKSVQFRTNMNNKYLVLKMYGLLKSMFYSERIESG